VSIGTIAWLELSVITQIQICPVGFISSSWTKSSPDRKMHRRELYLWCYLIFTDLESDEQIVFYVLVYW